MTAQYGHSPIGGDLMGPEAWEAAQMARAEAMLVSSTFPSQQVERQS